MNCTLEVQVSPGQRQGAYHTGDVLSVYMTEDLAEETEGEWRFRDTIENSPFHYIHVTGVPDSVKIETIISEYKVPNGSPDLTYARENPYITVRRRKWFIDASKVPLIAKKKLKQNKEITVTFDQLKKVLAKKRAVDHDDPTRDTVDSYVQDSDI